MIESQEGIFMNDRQKKEKYGQIIFSVMTLMLLTAIPAISSDGARENVTFVKWTYPTE